MNKLLVLISVFSFLGFLAIVLLTVLSTRKKLKLQSKLLGVSSTTKTKWSNKFNDFAQRWYNLLLRVPLLKTVVIRIRKRIETLSIYDEYSLRREVMKIIFVIFSVFAVVGVLLVAIRPNYLIVFWVFVGMFFTSGLMVDFFVYRVEARLLKQLKEFNNRVRFFFQQTKMVDESVFESISFAGPEMKIQAERIYSILSSLEPEIELTKYEEVAPSRFLKVLAGLVLMVKEEGDVISDQGSAFLAGLTAINVELNNDILYRQKLEYRLRGLTTIAIAPIFLALPIKMWAVNTFPIMASFYESRIGFISEVFVYGVSVLAYILIRKIRDVSENKYYMNMQKERWEKILLKKVPLLGSLIKIFKPKQFSKREYKWKKLINAANSPLDIDSIAVQRFLLSLSILVILLSGFIFGHYREKHNVMYSVSSTAMFAGNTTEEEKSILRKETAFDRELIIAMESQKIKSKEEVEKFVLASLGKSNGNDPETKKVVERVSTKFHTVNNAFLKWWEVLVAFILMYVTSYVPIFILMYQKALRKKDMENEVYQFLILIGILKEFESMSVFKILTWLDRFSIIFKAPIQEAIQNYDAGAEDALYALIEKVGFEPFQQIIERLHLSVTRISIKESFDDIDIERAYYIEQRRESNERSIDIRGLFASVISWTPVTALIFLYLVIPLIYISINESQDLIMKIQ